MKSSSNRERGVLENPQEPNSSQARPLEDMLEYYIDFINKFNIIIDRSPVLHEMPEDLYTMMVSGAFEIVGIQSHDEVIFKLGLEPFIGKLDWSGYIGLHNFIRLLRTEYIRDSTNFPSSVVVRYVNEFILEINNHTPKKKGDLVFPLLRTAMVSFGLFSFEDVIIHTGLDYIKILKELGKWYSTETGFFRALHGLNAAYLKEPSKCPEINKIPDYTIIQAYINGGFWKKYKINTLWDFYHASFIPRIMINSFFMDHVFREPMSTFVEKNEISIQYEKFKHYLEQFEGDYGRMPFNKEIPKIYLQLIGQGYFQVFGVTTENNNIHFHHLPMKVDMLEKSHSNISELIQPSSSKSHKKTTSNKSKKIVKSQLKHTSSETSDNNPSGIPLNILQQLETDLNMRMTNITEQDLSGRQGVHSVFTLYQAFIAFHHRLPDENDLPVAVMDAVFSEKIHFIFTDPKSIAPKTKDELDSLMISLEPMWEAYSTKIPERPYGPDQWKSDQGLVYSKWRMFNIIHEIGYIPSSIELIKLDGRLRHYIVNKKVYSEKGITDYESFLIYCELDPKLKGIKPNKDK